MLAKLKHIASVVYDKMGDPRSKNVLLFVLALLTLFGMIAPDAATSLRDTVLALAN